MDGDCPSFHDTVPAILLPDRGDWGGGFPS